MYLYGKNSVIERLRKNPGSIKKIYLQKKVNLSEVVLEIKNAGLNFESIEKDEIEKRFSIANHQGVFAEVTDFIYVEYSTIVDLCVSRKNIPVFLDGITDPQNLGSIIRNLSCLGGYSVVLSNHKSVKVNETVLKVASGGDNYINISLVENIATALNELKKSGVSVYGAMVENPSHMDIYALDFNGPIALVMGAEGKGIRPGVEKQLDRAFSLPMNGAPISYNVTVATMLSCYIINKSLNKQD